MNPFDFHLDHPWILLLVPFLLAAFFSLKFVIRRRDAIPYPPLQDKTGGSKTRWLYGLTAALESLLIILVCLSLAGPYRSFEITSIDEEGIDVMLLVDISSSMQATDFPPTRLEATKAILDEFVRKSGGNRVGVTVFAKRIFTLSPLTTSHDLLRKLIKDLNLNTIDHYQSGGTAIGDAILYATDALNAAKIKNRAQVIILLTDGESNDGMDVTLATKYAADNAIKIDSVGLGSTTPIVVKPDASDPEWSFETMLTEEPLIDIAKITGGHYYAAKNGELMAKIFDELSRLERTPLHVGNFRQKKYARYPLTLSIALLFVATIALKTIFLRRPLR